MSEGSRTNPDGSVLSWRLTDPYAFPMDGTVPFLLDWGNAAHPGGVTPPAGTLKELVLTHPQADDLREGLGGLGLEIAVESGSAAVRATIQTARGPVTLR